jgi:hypothetical protein
MPAQIARYAIPAAAGEQAGLIDDGLDAIALSSAGELPLPSSENGRERLDTDTLARMGPAFLALISALDASTSAPAGGPGNFLWTQDNLLPGWSVGLFVLALLLPPLAVAASVLARAMRDGGSIARAFSWAIEWWIPAVVISLGIYGLAVLDVIPSSGVPYDPARFELGVSEAVGLVLVIGLAAWLWWVLHLRRIPSPPGALGVGAAAGLAAVAACVVVWLANPYMALLLVPLAHLVAVLGTQGRRPAALAMPVLALTALPLAVALVYVGSELDWGASTPLQLAVLMAGGGIGPVQAIGCVLTLSSVAAVATAALATARANSASRAENLTGPEIRGETGVGSSDDA